MSRTQRLTLSHLQSRRGNKHKYNAHRMIVAAIEIYLRYRAENIEGVT